MPREDLEYTRAISAAKLLNNTFRRHDSNIEANIEVAINLDQFINQLERGEIYEKDYEAFTNYFNKAILYTAGNEATNKDLEECGEMIIGLLQFPVVDPDLLVVLFREFQKRLLNAHHGHATIGEQIEQFAKIQILANKEIMVPETILPPTPYRKQSSKGFISKAKEWRKKK